MIIEAGGFWLSDDKIIAVVGAIIMAYFLGLWVGEARKK
jgi:hypothetical protein